MKIYVMVAGTQIQKDQFASIIKESDWHGEWDNWTQSFIFIEDVNPEMIIDDLERLAEENKLRIKCDIEYPDEVEEEIEE